MSTSGVDIPEDWLEALGGSDASGWLAAFQHDATVAVTDLLWTRFYFGPLNPHDGADLLAGWLEVLANSNQFSTRLDTALEEWIEHEWGKLDKPAPSLISAWTRVCRVIEFSAKLREESRLERSGAALTARFPLSGCLGTFSSAPSADPLGFYFGAIAEFQYDRLLAGFWHRLCELPTGVPHYHARFAILGLRGLPAVNKWEEGSLRADVVVGLIRMAEALDRLARERELQEPIARATIRRVAAQTAAAYPDSPRWAEHGLEHLANMAERAREWLLEVVPPLAKAWKQKTRATTTRVTGTPALRPNPNWTARSRTLRPHILRGEVKALPQLLDLLQEERLFTEIAGDAYDLVHTLRSHAVAIVRHKAEYAVRWAVEALSWAPDDPRSWNQIAQIMLHRGDSKSALTYAWIAWKRFPENVVARNGLAEVLKAAGRLPGRRRSTKKTSN